MRLAGDEHALADRIAVGREPFCQSVTEDDDALGADAVIRSAEEPACVRADAEEGKERPRRVDRANLSRFGSAIEENPLRRVAGNAVERACALERGVGRS